MFSVQASIAIINGIVACRFVNANLLCRRLVPFTCQDINMNKTKFMRLIVGCLVVVAMVKVFFGPR